jgi:hypothetical protein
VACAGLLDGARRDGLTDAEAIVLVRVGNHLIETMAALINRVVRPGRQAAALAFVLRYVGETHADTRRQADTFGTAAILAAQAQILAEQAQAERSPCAEGKDWPHG